MVWAREQLQRGGLKLESAFWSVFLFPKEACGLQPEWFYSRGEEHVFDTMSALVGVLEKGYVYRVTGKQGTGGLCFLRLGNCFFFFFFEVQTPKKLSAIGPQGLLAAVPGTLYQGAGRGRSESAVPAG